ncbi:unnamed protein product [Notodromas monacha]|uniref:t-SNARE coiled-coil homology domain-containing protein n=1 Tax=Notodromas monacha TaxID=399045 RepID=A0A7R9BLF9_9CRUS|nr:unnamed protein product [Notodromas monacha]CAG0916332.1 unnamed protein product [Notodromas monacha]
MDGYPSYQNVMYKDGEFKKLCRKVTENIGKISQNATEMQKMIAQLGSTQDSEAFKSELHNLQHYTKMLSTDTKDKLKELRQILPEISPSEQKFQRLMLDRLTNDFTAALNQFQNLQKAEAEKEKQQVKRARNKSMGILPPPSSSATASLIPLEPQPQYQRQMFAEEDDDLLQLQDREAAINRLEEDIRDVNEIFKDLATLVHTQGEIVDSIEASVETAYIQVDEGVQQLRKANQHQTSARKKKLILISIAIGILVTMGLVIYLSS